MPGTIVCVVVTRRRPGFTDRHVPAVTGTVKNRPRDIDELLPRIREIAGVPDGEVVDPVTSAVLPIEVLLHSPDS